jgi:hypothetical protein
MNLELGQVEALTYWISERMVCQSSVSFGWPC